MRAVILVVERDPHVRELERYFLEEAGFAVEFATDGLQALDLARQLLPAIVITEILVPKADGLTVCRTLKQEDKTRHIVVLVLSILAAEDRAREAGAASMLSASGGPACRSSRAWYRPRHSGPATRP